MTFSKIEALQDHKVTQYKKHISSKLYTLTMDERKFFSSKIHLSIMHLKNPRRVLKILCAPLEVILNRRNKRFGYKCRRQFDLNSWRKIVVIWTARIVRTMWASPVCWIFGFAPATTAKRVNLIPWNHSFARRRIQDNIAESW